jgi:hypothetical protein
MTKKKGTLELQPGDRIIWPEHDLQGNGTLTRHESGSVVRVLYDGDGSAARVVCTREWFMSGILATHEVEEKTVCGA